MTPHEWGALYIATLAPVAIGLGTYVVRDMRKSILRERAEREKR